MNIEGPCGRCEGEGVIWGGSFQDGTSNCFDPCPDCMGFDDEEQEESNG